MNIILKHYLYKELKRYAYNKKQAKQRYRELLSIIYTNEELKSVTNYYKNLNEFYGK